MTSVAPAASVAASVLLLDDDDHPRSARHLKLSGILHDIPLLLHAPNANAVHRPPRPSNFHFDDSINDDEDKFVKAPNTRVGEIVDGVSLVLFYFDIATDVKTGIIYYHASPTTFVIFVLCLGNRLLQGLHSEFWSWGATTRLKTKCWRVLLTLTGLNQAVNYSRKGYLHVRTHMRIDALEEVLFEAAPLTCVQAVVLFCMYNVKPEGLDSQGILVLTWTISIITMVYTSTILYCRENPVDPTGLSTLNQIFLGKVVPFFFCLTDVVIRCASFVCITVFVALSLPLSWSVSTQQDGGSGSMFDKAIIIGLIIIVLAFATFSFCTSLFLHYKSFRGLSFAHLKKTNLAIEALCSPFSSLPAARTGSNAMLLKNVIESTVIFFMMAVAGLAMADITANSATGNTGKSSEEIRDLEVASELATSAAILALTFLLTLRPGFYWLMLKQQERLTRQRLRLAAKKKLLASVQPLNVRDVCKMANIDDVANRGYSYTHWNSACGIMIFVVILIYAFFEYSDSSTDTFQGEVDCNLDTSRSLARYLNPTSTTRLIGYCPEARNLKTIYEVWDLRGSSVYDFGSNLVLPNLETIGLTFFNGTEAFVCSNSYNLCGLSSGVSKNNNNTGEGTFSLNLPLLKSVAGGISMKNFLFSSIKMPSLLSVSKFNLMDTGKKLNTLDIAALRTCGTLTLNSTNLASLQLPKIQFVSTIVITGNNLLRNISEFCPAISTLSSVDICNNAALTPFSGVTSVVSPCFNFIASPLKLMAGKRCSGNSCTVGCCDSISCVV